MYKLVRFKTLPPDLMEYLYQLLWYAVRVSLFLKRLFRGMNLIFCLVASRPDLHPEEVPLPYQRNDQHLRQSCGHGNVWKRYVCMYSDADWTISWLSVCLKWSLVWLSLCKFSSFLSLSSCIIQLWHFVSWCLLEMWRNCSSVTFCGLVCWFLVHPTISPGDHGEITHLWHFVGLGICVKIFQPSHLKM